MFEESATTTLEVKEIISSTSSTTFGPGVLSSFAAPAHFLSPFINFLAIGFLRFGTMGMDTGLASLLSFVYWPKGQERIAERRADTVSRFSADPASGVCTEGEVPDRREETSRFSLEPVSGVDPRELAYTSKLRSC